MRHISALLYLDCVKQERGSAFVSEIYKVFNEISLHVRGLENLLSSLKAEDILIPLIVSKFPNSVVHEYSKIFKAKPRI